MTSAAGDQDLPRDRRWSEVFHRSTLSPVVFNVARDFERPTYQALESTGLPVVSDSSLFSNLYRSVALLDGFVLELLTYGFPAGRLRSGLRIVGHAPMRLLCELLGLRPPSRRLVGEQDMSSPDELLEALDQMLLRPREELEERARLGLHVSDGDSLVRLVWQTYGDEALPTATLEALRRTRPADDEWGDQGFTAGERDEALTAGITLTEALAWRELGCGIQEATRLREHGVDVLRPWVEAGVGAGQASGYLSEGRKLDEVKPYLNVGVPPGWVHAFLNADLGPEVFEAFLAAGFTSLNACFWARAGLEPEQAASWRAIGLDPYPVAEILRGGGTLEDVKQLVAQGEPVRSVVKRFR